MSSKVSIESMLLSYYVHNESESEIIFSPLLELVYENPDELSQQCFSSIGFKLICLKEKPLISENLLFSRLEKDESSYPNKCFSLEFFSSLYDTTSVSNFTCLNLFLFSYALTCFSDELSKDYDFSDSSFNWYPVNVFEGFKSDLLGINGV